MDYQKRSIELHKEKTGKISVESKVPITNKDELSLIYTPGIAAVSLEIYKHPEQARGLTSTKNAVAIITDGSAVLGLGNIGPLAAIPVMEGKAVLFKRFAGIDSFPITLATQNVEEIIAAVKAIAPTFGAINLEDISAPRCFEIEERLKKELDIPVMHDDQHGTAIVILAGLLNALKVVNKKKENVRVVINGAGAAGIASVNILRNSGFGEIIVVDSKGIIGRHRNDLSGKKLDILNISNSSNLKGGLLDAISGADIFIGVSKGNLLSAKDIKIMTEKAVIFALANPIPEIMPDEAKKGGAAIVASGRSDFPNQINNALAYPGVFKGALEMKAKEITDKMKLWAAEALAGIVENPTEEKIIPDLFDEKIVPAICEAVKKAARL